MTWGGTKKIFKIVTLETGDMLQKVRFGPMFEAGAVAEAHCQKNKSRI
jgi:hypothetical protein